jgi:hypothetical protein
MVGRTRARLRSGNLAVDLAAATRRTIRRRRPLTVNLSDRARAGKILSLCGSAVLLFAWSVQQLKYEAWNGRLAELNTALAVYQTYQSNNALFNVLSKITPKSEQGSLRQLQVQNYQYGLNALDATVAVDRRPELDAEVAVNEKRQPNILNKIYPEFAYTQARLEVLQQSFYSERADIAVQKSLWRTMFTNLYLLGSLLVLSAAVVKPA